MRSAVSEKILTIVAVIDNKGSASLMRLTVLKSGSTNRGGCLRSAYG